MHGELGGLLSRSQKDCLPPIHWMPARKALCCCGWAHMNGGHTWRPRGASLEACLFRAKWRERRLLQGAGSAVALAVLLTVAADAGAGSREQAKRMHDRLAGVPPSAATLDAMAADIAGGNALDAAFTALDSPYFYNVTLKNF